MVGPWMDALRPPAHSTWATFSPSRSADWAIDSAWSTPGSKAAVRLPKGSPFLWKVLLVEPCTPGHAPVASVYQPAPVLGGAWVSSPPSAALTPFLSSFFIVGITPWAAYFSTLSWRMPSEAKKTALSVSALSGLALATLAAGAAPEVTACPGPATAAPRPATMRVVAAMTAVDRRREDDMWISLVLCLRTP